MQQLIRCHPQPATPGMRSSSETSIRPLWKWIPKRRASWATRPRPWGFWVLVIAENPMKMVDIVVTINNKNRGHTIYTLAFFPQEFMFFSFFPCFFECKWAPSKSYGLNSQHLKSIRMPPWWTLSCCRICSMFWSPGWLVQPHGPSQRSVADLSGLLQGLQSGSRGNWG